LGYIVGKKLGSCVPWFRFSQLDLPGNDLSSGAIQELLPLRALGAAMAASGAVALFHIEGITPEARSTAMLDPGAQTLVIDDLGQGYADLNDPVQEVDLVSIGCPHASLSELKEIAGVLGGRQVKTELWITVARSIRVRAEEAGLVAQIEAAGGRVVADTCMVVAPVEDLGFRAMATNSAKMATYAPSHSKMAVRFGTMAQCLDAALTGKWA
jgi:predicted aconitase